MAIKREGNGKREEWGEEKMKDDGRWELADCDDRRVYLTTFPSPSPSHYTQGACT